MQILNGKEAIELLCGSQRVLDDLNAVVKEK